MDTPRDPATPPLGGDLGLDMDHVLPARGEARSGPTCAACNRPIVDTYFEVAGKTTCAACKDAIEAAFQGGSRFVRFARASIGGFFAAAAGAAIYWGIGKATDREFALVAILVGILVGGAVRWGSHRRGGWGYQALAMFLTYASISAAKVPIVVGALLDHDKPVPAAATAGPADAPNAPSTPASEAAPAPAALPSEASSTPVPKSDSAAPSSGDEEDIDDAATDDSGAAADSTEGGEPASASSVTVEATEDAPSKSGVLAARHPVMALAVAGAGLLAIAAVAPFLELGTDFQNGAIGLFILGIALYQAWRMNRRVRIAFAGPYRVAAPGGQAAPA